MHHRTSAADRAPLRFPKSGRRDQRWARGSFGAGLAEVVCALVLDEQGVEREICDTGAKLAELLARLMAENTLPAPAGSRAPTSSAAAMASALRRASASAAVERKPVRILNLYVKRSAK